MKDKNGNEVKQTGRIVWIRNRNKLTGKLEDTACWIDGDNVYFIEKEDPITGKWVRQVREVDPADE
jgi:hypothetical protein